MSATPPRTRTTSGLPQRLAAWMPWLAAAMTAALVLAVLGVVITVQDAAHRDEVEASVVREGGRMRADLERAIDVRIARTEGLVGFATAEAAIGEIDEELFERYAQLAAQQSDVPLRSLQLAPDSVVTHVYPLEGNEEAIGHDLLADPDRRDAVLQTVEARRTMVAGPFELIQGGLAIVARAPVFLPTEDGGEEWWGLATVVAAAEPLFAEAHLDGSPDVEVALRGRDGLGADGDVFYGDPAVFERDPELFEVTLPAGTWQLAVMPTGGWDGTAWPGRLLTMIAMSGLALLLAALVYRVLRSRSRVERLLDDRAELISTANVPIVQVSRDRRISVWNAEAADASGLDADPAGRGVHDPELATNGLVRAVAELAEEVLATGVRIEGHVVSIERPDGTRAELLWNAGPITDAGGTVTDVVVVAQDITARAEADRIRSDHEALTATTRLKDEFLATMSHELRTPLNGIIGLTSLLQDETAGPLNPTQRTYLQHTRDAGTHLLQLINDVLDMSRLDADDNNLEMEPVAVDAAVHKALRMVRSDAEERGLELRVQIEEDLFVLADERRLVQVVLNLLANAVKFTDDGAVDVAATSTVDTVRITVQDTGIGIADADLGRLFLPFVQLEASLDRRYEGSGLGLALSQRFVGAFGGRIEVDSTPGEGSTFTVTLPRATSAAQQATDAEVAPVTAPTGASATVLVAEDNDVNRLIVTEYLRSLGYDHVTATNGVEAVELARRVQPRLVLMDVQMPTMDGLEATGILKADPSTSHIPVVALTAMAMQGDEERCLEAGCDAYLSKPIELPRLAATIEELLGAAIDS